MSSPTELDPYLNDPLRWGASMAHHAELMLACLDAVGARTVLEVGAYAGDLTRVLVDWARDGAALVQAIDPVPQPGLVALAQAHPELELIRETSLDALPRLELAEAIVIDGDHNYHTVSEELRLIGERAAQAASALPLLFLHDVCWPHGRRDDYFDVSQIPAERRRQPLVGDGRGITPDDPGVAAGGLPYPRSAAREGGPHNGVLTAVEDFVAQREDLRLVVVPAFFGFGVAWQRSAPWAGAVAEILDPWDRHPLVARLEANRVSHVAAEHALRIEIWRLQERLGRRDAVLARLLDSSAFAVAETLSRLRARAGIATDQSIVSRAQIRRALED